MFFRFATFGSFGVCDRDNVTSGSVFPVNDSFDNLKLSEYFVDITYSLTDLISLFEIETDEASPESNSR